MQRPPQPFVNLFAHLPQPASQMALPIASPFPQFPHAPPMIHRVVYAAQPPRPGLIYVPGHSSVPAPAPSAGSSRVAVLFVDSAAGHYQFLLRNKSGRDLEVFAHTLYRGQSRSVCADMILSQGALPQRHMKHFDITDHATGISTRVFVYHMPGISGSSMTRSMARTRTSGSMKRIDATAGIGAGIIQDTSRAVFNIDSHTADVLRYAATNIHHLI
jgi:hypothetical protein